MINKISIFFAFENKKWSDTCTFRQVPYINLFFNHNIEFISLMIKISSSKSPIFKIVIFPNEYFWNSEDELRNGYTINLTGITFV